jgi:uncharacterized membrane protein YczE
MVARHVPVFSHRRSVGDFFVPPRCGGLQRLGGSCLFCRNRVLDVVLRWALLVVGLSLMSIGIAFSIRSELGTTPISSLPFVLSILTPLSVGTLMILMNLVFVGLQIVILRRRFRPVQLLQIPVVVLFGLLNDAGLWLLRDVTHSAYWQQWLLVVGFQVKAQTIPLAGEGLILAISDTLMRRFGVRRHLVFSSVKVQFDTTLVLVSAVIGVLATHALVGVREGTVAAALCVGFVAQLTIRALDLVRPVEEASIHLVDSSEDLSNTATEAV